MSFLELNTRKSNEYLEEFKDITLSDLERLIGEKNFSKEGHFFIVPQKTELIVDRYFGYPTLNSNSKIGRNVLNEVSWYGHINDSREESIIISRSLRERIIFSPKSKRYFIENLGEHITDFYAGNLGGEYDKDSDCILLPTSADYETVRELIVNKSLTKQSS